MEKLSLSILMMLLFSQASYADSSKGKYTLSTGTTFTSGDYGSSDTTEVYYTPLSLKYKTDKWSLKLTVPYLRIKGPQNVIRDIGQVTQSTTTGTATNDGLGDIVFSSSYRLFYLPKSKTLLNIDGKIKFGTADEDKSLGTGKNDYSLSLGLYKLMGNFTPYATLGRRFYGQPSTTKLDDVFFGSVGLGYKFSSKISTGINLYLKEPTASTRPSTRQLSAYLSYKLDQNWKIQGYLIRGLSDNAPDLGSGFSLAYQFN
ncbi:MAG: transporter [Methylophaga sp.]|nr:transporter [Methylophaga sp.]